MTETGFGEAHPERLGVADRAGRPSTGGAAVAEDVAAEAPTRGPRRGNRIADRALAWVARVATDLAIDHLRSAGRRRSPTATSWCASPRVGAGQGGTRCVTVGTSVLASDAPGPAANLLPL